MPAAEADLAVIAEQERTLRFSSFNPDTAWQLGCRLRDLAAGRGAAAMGVWMGGQTLFYATLPGVVPSHEDWLRRKRNTVLRFGKSSYRVGMEMRRDGTTLEVRQGLALADFADHGGGFPLQLKETGCVGCIGFSGLPQREDHALVVEAIAGVLGVDVVRLEMEKK